MKLILTTKDNGTILAGEIVAMENGHGSAEEKLTVATIRGKVYDKEASAEVDKDLKVELWNSTSKNGNPVNMSDWFRGRAAVGDVVLFRAVPKMKDGVPTGDYNAYAFNIIVSAAAPEKTYSAIMTVGEGDDEINVIEGRLCGYEETPAQDTTSERVRMSIPTRENGEDVWRSITFWDNGRNNLHGVKTCLSKAKRAIIVTGKKRDVNGRAYYNGYSFELLPR